MNLNILVCYIGAGKGPSRDGIGNTFVFFTNFFFPEIADLSFASTFSAKNMDYLRKIFWESINEREKSGFKRGDLLDSLLELKNAKQDTNFRKCVFVNKIKNCF